MFGDDCYTIGKPKKINKVVISVATTCLDIATIVIKLRAKSSKSL